MSTYSFQPICPTWVIVMWGLVCLGLILHAWRRQRDEVPTRIRVWLIVLRIGGLALLITLFLRPWRETSIPQPGASRVIILADSSASMFDHTDAQDENGKLLRRWDAAVDALPEHFPWTAERLRFADQGLLSWTAEATALPGETALGDALDEALESRNRPGALPLAAVVLLTDGCETAPDSSLVDAARHARTLKIPVSTLVVGSPEVPPNASVAFTAHRLSVPQGERIALTAQASSDFPKPINVNLTILDNLGQQRDSRQIQLSPNSPASIAFDLPPIDHAGDYAFTVLLSGQGEDGRPADDTDTILVHIEEPPQRKLLYLASNPGWEWRFLRPVAEAANDLEISAILRIGRSDDDLERLPADFRPTRLFHRYHLPETAGEDLGFPATPAEYSDFDAVVLECAAAATFTAEHCEALLAFVERRGGGLLLIGSPEGLPEVLQRMLPAKDFEERQAPVRNTLLVNREFIFENGATPPGRWEGRASPPHLLPCCSHVQARFAHCTRRQPWRCASGSTGELWRRTNRLAGGGGKLAMVSCPTRGRWRGDLPRILGSAPHLAWSQSPADVASGTPRRGCCHRQACHARRLGDWSRFSSGASRTGSTTCPNAEP